MSDVGLSMRKLYLFTKLEAYVLVESLYYFMESVSKLSCIVWVLHSIEPTSELRGPFKIARPRLVRSQDGPEQT